MNKNFIFLGSLSAGIAVMFGAFGAHALKSRLSMDQLQVFETGVKYQFYHSLALILLGLVIARWPLSNLNYCGWLFIIGIVLFSGSLYLLAMNDMLGLNSIKKFIGPLTPLGGLSFVIAWILLAVGIYKNN